MLYYNIKGAQLVSFICLLTAQVPQSVTGQQPARHGVVARQQSFFDLIYFWPERTHFRPGWML